jgi:hypothetical protein
MEVLLMIGTLLGVLGVGVGALRMKDLIQPARRCPYCRSVVTPRV